MDLGFYHPTVVVILSGLKLPKEYQEKEWDDSYYYYYRSMYEAIQGFGKGDMNPLTSHFIDTFGLADEI